MTSDFESEGLTRSQPAGDDQAAEAHEIRARRRWGTILGVYAVHAVLALALAWPLAGVLADPATALPQGDAVLFEPGGLYLMEAARKALRPLASTAKGELWLVLWASYAGLLPLAALLHALNRRSRPRFADLAAGAARCFGRYSILLGAALVAMAFSGGFFALAGSALGARADAGMGRSIAVAGLAGLVLAVLGVAHDLARAAVVRHDANVRDALILAGRALRHAPLRALFGWAWRGALGLLAVLGAAALSQRFRIETGRGLLQAVTVHQAAAAALVALRASWLAQALRLVAGLPMPQPEPDPEIEVFPSVVPQPDGGPALDDRERPEAQVGETSDR